MTTRSPYAIQPHRYCPGCLAKGFHYRQDDERHYMLHVPRSHWPESMRPAHKARVVRNGLVFDADDPAVSGEEPAPVLATLPDEHGTGVAQSSETAPACECGYQPKSAQALRMHRMKAKQHQGARDG